MTESYGINIVTQQKRKTLRLKMPQWQGGNLPAYHFGSELLAWLALQNDNPVAKVAIDTPNDAPLRCHSKRAFSQSRFC
ncbi:hypothetical protein [Celeribacter ethanolicus]|uniref:hypothetical protein n=1 Tax=Celeribacter ethanolicus TaxID=1758178 RepID=UPI000ABC0F6F|nr:hypothetical protein [Celeribacter ethanolicus]